MPVKPSEIYVDPNNVKQGTLQRATFTSDLGVDMPTNIRLADGAIWLDRGVMGREAFKDGWYYLDDTDEPKFAPSAPAMVGDFAPTKFGGYETITRKEDGTVWLDPSFAGVKKAGFYKEGDLTKPVADPGFWKKTGHFVADGTKHVVKAMGKVVKDEFDTQIQKQRAMAKEQMDAADRGDSFFSRAGAAVKTTTSDAAGDMGRFSMGAAKGLGKVGTLATGAGTALVGKAIDDPALVRAGRNIATEDVIWNQYDRAKAQLGAEEASRNLSEASMKLKILKGQGKNQADDPEFQTAAQQYDQALRQAMTAERGVQAESGSVDAYNEELKGLGEMGEFVGSTTGDLALMGGAHKSFLALGKRAMALKNPALREALIASGEKGLTKLGQIEKRLGTLAAFTEDTIGQTGKVARGLDAAAKPAGLVTRTGARVVEGMAMGAPTQGMDLAQRIATEDNLGTAIAGNIKTGLHGALTMPVMNSERIRALTTKLDGSKVSGAIGNALGRTMLLAGASTAADGALGLVNGDPSFANLPHHIKGLLGLELMTALKGIGGARKTVKKAGEVQAEATGTLAELQKARENSEAMAKAVKNTLEKTKADPNANPEDLTLLEQKHQEEIATLNELDSHIQLAEHVKADAEGAAKQVGVKPEQLQERAQELTPKPKKALADPVRGMMGEAKPEPKKVMAKAPEPAPEQRSEGQGSGKGSFRLMSDAEMDELLREPVSNEVDMPRLKRESTVPPEVETDLMRQLGLDKPENRTRENMEKLEKAKTAWIDANPEKAAASAGAPAGSGAADPHGILPKVAEVADQVTKSLAIGKAKVEEKVQTPPAPKGMEDDGHLEELNKLGADKALNAKTGKDSNGAFADHLFSTDKELTRLHLRDGAEEFAAEIIDGKAQKELRTEAADKRAAGQGPVAKALEAKAATLDRWKAKFANGEDGKSTGFVKLKLDLADHLANDSEAHKLFRELRPSDEHPDVTRTRAAVSLLNEAQRIASTGQLGLGDALKQVYAKKVSDTRTYGGKVSHWELKALSTWSEAKRAVSDTYSNLRRDASALREHGDELISGALRANEKRQASNKQLHDVITKNGNMDDKAALAAQARINQLREEAAVLQKKLDNRKANPESTEGLEAYGIAAVASAKDDLLAQVKGRFGKRIVNPDGTNVERVNLGNKTQNGKDKLEPRYAIQRNKETGKDEVIDKRTGRALTHEDQAHGLTKGFITVDGRFMSREQAEALWRLDVPGQEYGKSSAKDAEIFYNGNGPRKVDEATGKNKEAENGLTDEPATYLGGRGGFVEGTTMRWVMGPNGYMVPAPKETVKVLESTKAGEGGMMRNSTAEVPHYDIDQFKAQVDRLTDLSNKGNGTNFPKGVDHLDPRVDEASLGDGGAAVGTMSRGPAAKPSPERMEQTRQEAIKRITDLKAQGKAEDWQNPAQNESPEAFKARIEASRAKQQVEGPTYSPEVHDLIEKTIKTYGIGGLAITHDQLLKRLEAFGAIQTNLDGEGVSREGRVILTPEQFQAVMDMPERLQVFDAPEGTPGRAKFNPTPEGKRVAESGNQMGDFRDRQAVLEGENGKFNTHGDFADKEAADRRLSGVQKEAIDEHRAARNEAAKTLGELYRAGVLKASDFIMEPKAHDYDENPSSFGTDIYHKVHRNVDFRSQVREALDEVAGVDENIAAQLHDRIAETRQNPATGETYQQGDPKFRVLKETPGLKENTAPEGQPEKWAEADEQAYVSRGKWIPNPESVENLPIFRRDLAQQDLPAQGDKARADMEKALGQNASLRSSMQRMMAHEELLGMANELRMKPGSTEKDQRAADILERRAKEMIHEGDQILFDHIEATTGSYFKPIPEPKGSTRSVGAVNPTLGPDDIRALVNPNHANHELVKDWFKGQDVHEYGVQPEEIADPLAHRQMEARAALRDLQGRAERIYGIKAATPEEATKQILDRATGRGVQGARNILGDLNRVAESEATIARWEKSKSPELVERAKTYRWNEETINRMTEGDPEAQKIISRFFKALPPEVASTLTILEGSKDAEGSYDFSNNTLKLHEGFKEAIAQKRTADAVRAFFHESGHWITSHLDEGFRDRIRGAHRDHVRRLTDSNPILDAIVGKDSPLDYRDLSPDFLNGRDLFLNQHEAADLRARLNAPEVHEALRAAGVSNPGKVIDGLFREVAKDGYTHRFDFRELTRENKELREFYRMLTPDEYFAEAFADFGMAMHQLQPGWGGKTAFEKLAGEEHYSDMVGDMAEAHDIWRALDTRNLTGPRGKRTVLDAMNIINALRGSNPFRESRVPVPVHRNDAQPVQFLERIEGMRGQPPPQQERTFRNAVDHLDGRIYDLMAKQASIFKGPISKLVELTAADALDPRSRSFSHLLQARDARSFAMRAADETHADAARLALAEHFRKDTSRKTVRAIQDAIDNGTARQMTLPSESRGKYRLYRVEHDGKVFWANTAANDTTVFAHMSDGQRDAYRFIESNGKVGGETLAPELRKQLTEWIDKKQEFEQIRKDMLMEAPGVSQEMLNKSWIKDYLPHLFADAKIGRKLDGLYEEDRTVTGLDRLQKREFDTFDQAFMKKGLLPRFANPIEAYLHGAREFQRMSDVRNAIGVLQERGLAHFGYREDAPEGFTEVRVGPEGSLAANRLGFIQEQPMVENGAQPDAPRMPNKTVWVAPEVKPVIEALYGKGFGVGKGAKFYKAAMLVNHILSPAKLTLSAFHLGTITKLGAVDTVKQVWSNYERLRASGVSSEEARARSYDAAAGQALVASAFKSGKEFRQLWLDHGYKNLDQLDESGLSNLEKATLAMMQVGNYSAMVNKLLETRNREAFRDALSDLSPIRTLWNSYTGGMERLQDGLMNHAVAPVKTGHIVMDIQRMLKAKYGENGPEDFGQFTRDLYNSKTLQEGAYETTQLAEFARQSINHADSVFGMVNYRKLMMHPKVKDLMHLWNLSFGWRMGNLRILGKAMDEVGNKTPLLGGAYKGWKRSMGSTGLQDVSWASEKPQLDIGRNEVKFLASHGAVDSLVTLTLAALASAGIGATTLPNWKKEAEDEQGFIENARLKLEDLLFPQLSGRLNHNSLANRFSTGGYLGELYGVVKHPGKFIIDHAAGNSPLLGTGKAMLTGEDAIGNEIGNPHAILPDKVAEPIAAWLADPNGNAAAQWLAKRALQVPAEFIPISVSNTTRLMRQGEEPLVALSTALGARKLSDYGGIGQDNATQAAMKASTSGNFKTEARTAEQQELKLYKEEAAANALNKVGENPMEGLDNLVGKGYSQGQVTLLKKRLFEADGTPRKAFDRYFMGLDTLKKLQVAETANKAQFERVWGPARKSILQGIANMEKKNPVRAAQMREMFGLLEKRNGDE